MNNLKLKDLPHSQRMDLEHEAAKVPSRWRRYLFILAAVEFIPFAAVIYFTGLLSNADMNMRGIWICIAIVLLLQPLNGFFLIMMRKEQVARAEAMLNERTAAITTCPKCDVQIPIGNARFCPACGAALMAEPGVGPGVGPGVDDARD